MRPAGQECPSIEISRLKDRVFFVKILLVHGIGFYLLGAVSFAAAMIVTALASLAVILAVVVLRRPPATGHRIGRFWARLILLASGVRVRIEGQERIDPRRPCIFAANHQSQFDILVLQGRFAPEFRWFAKQELFRIPLLGPAMRSAGYISVDRGNGRDALRSLDAAAARIAAGSSVVMFPEGTRSRDGRLQEFKSGAMLLAIKARVPVVPVAILGTREILPRGAILSRPGSVTIRVGEPISTAGLRPKDRQELSDRVRKSLVNLGCTNGDHQHLDEIRNVG